MSVECFIEVWSAAGCVRLLEGVFVVQTVLSVPGKTGKSVLNKRFASVACFSSGLGTEVCCREEFHGS